MNRIHASETTRDAHRFDRWRRALATAIVVLLGTALSPPPSSAQPDVSKLFEMNRRDEGEPIWAPLIRLREAEATYKEDRGAWMSYIQLRAQAESVVGNHQAALEYWESIRPERDSTAVLPDGAQTVDAIQYLSDAAEIEQVIMINERHHAAVDRMLTLRLLPILYEKGFRYFAAEAIYAADSTLSERGYPIEDVTGYYTNECIFATLVREAHRIGYKIIPYEQEKGQGTEFEDLRPQQQRDRSQAQNLHDRIFAVDPEARVLVHAGFGHIQEEETERWSPMALYFREFTGIDPLTVDQTIMGEGSAPGYENALRRGVAAAGWSDTPVVLVGPKNHPVDTTSFSSDLQVFTPPTKYESGRPTWLVEAGVRVPIDVSVPECADQTCFVEVRDSEESAEAVALDRLEIVEKDSIRVLVPRDASMEVEISDADGTWIRTVEIES